MKLETMSSRDLAEIINLLIKRVDVLEEAVRSLESSVIILESDIDYVTYRNV